MNTGAAGACFAVVWSRALLDDETYQTNRKCRMTAELLSCWFDYSGSLRRSARAPAGLPCFFFFVLVGLFSLAGVSPARACPTPASAPCDPHGSLAVSPFVLLLGSFQSITRSVKRGPHETKSWSPPGLREESFMSDWLALDAGPRPDIDSKVPNTLSADRLAE